MKHKILLCILLAIVIAVKCVDRSKFRTCADTGFCRRYRNSPIPQHDKIYLEKSSLRQISESQFVGTVRLGATTLNLEINALVSGSFRVRITENKDRWQPSDILMPQGLVGVKASIISDETKLPSVLRRLSKEDFIPIASADDGVILVIWFSPFRLELYRGEQSVILVNDRSLLHYEVKLDTLSKQDTSSVAASSVDRHHGKKVVDYGEDGLAIYDDGTKEEKSHAEETSPTAAPTVGNFAESFGGHTDTMPNGPVSVGFDVSFPHAQHVYGLPEHTSPLSLPTTTTGSAGIEPHYREPYRLYNLDVFEYELDQTMALYGHIPFLMAHGLTNGYGTSAGVFWFNPSETFVDISDGGELGRPYKQSHWMSESGAWDLFLFAGPTPKDVFQQMTLVTGRQQLPPIFALGYHQCRWNYRDERDVAAVEAGFEDLDYPMDVIWLDIEHTDGKRYFTWDKAVFPNPVEMQKNVSNHGRRMVTIIDPHIKTDRNYHIHKEATDRGLYIKEPDGVTDYKGWCWPGESSYLDFTDGRVRQWWAEQFALDKYIGSTMDLFTWNDMNEPSVFNGPEVSMRKDMKNLAGIEHREWHNLYGIYMQRATSEGLTMRAPSSGPKPRPFVLSRAFFAGSQRYGAIWTGDNTAQWGHLKIASPMLLAINLGGLSFAGADVGGFFGDPDAELFVRWNQAGAFTPFYRGHAHHDSKRREPWVYGEPYTTINRATAMLRYSLLPFWYTTFYEAYARGLPVMRSLFAEYPDEIETFAIDDQWLIGDSILVKPVTDPGAVNVAVYFPGKEPWYDLVTYEMFAPSSVSGARTVVNAPLSVIPAFIRGGRIVPRKLRLRRSSKLMFYDPLTLIVALDQNDEAEGYLYLDDETTLDHEMFGHKASSLRKFSFKNRVLHNNASSWTSDLPQEDGYSAVNTVERVIIVGLSRPPSKVILKAFGNPSVELLSNFDESRRLLTIKKPDVRATDSWSITLA